MSKSILKRLKAQHGELPRHVLQQQIVELEKQREELLFALQIIAESKTCPAVFAQLAANAIAK